MSVSIYRIYSDKGELQYYGSTKYTIQKRFTDHKSNYKYNTNKSMSIKLFQEYGVENCYIELLEEVTDDLRKEREAYYIKTFECVNKLIPGRTQKEYNEKNKIKIAEQNKKYREEHKDKYAEYQKEYQKKYQKARYQRKKISSNVVDNAEEE